jgi:hypothetical protein
MAFQVLPIPWYLSSVAEVLRRKEEEEGEGVPQRLSKLIYGTRCQVMIAFAESSQYLPKAGIHKIPVDEFLDKGCEVIRPPVLVIQVVGVFPNIRHEKGF